MPKAVSVGAHRTCMDSHLRLPSAKSSDINKSSFSSKINLEQYRKIYTQARLACKRLMGMFICSSGPLRTSDLLLMSSMTTLVYGKPQTFDVWTTLPNIIDKINLMYSILVPPYLKYCGCLQPLPITIDFHLPLSFTFHQKGPLLERKYIS
jgi:hypothetical protein